MRGSKELSVVCRSCIRIMECCQMMESSSWDPVPCTDVKSSSSKSSGGRAAITEEMMDGSHYVINSRVVLGCLMSELNLSWSALTGGTWAEAGLGHHSCLFTGVSSLTNSSWQIAPHSTCVILFYTQANHCRLHRPDLIHSHQHWHARREGER